MKKVLLVLFLGFSNLLHSQIFNDNFNTIDGTGSYNKGVINFRDGSEKNGLIKITMSGNEIKYKASRKEKPVLLNYKKVKSIKIISDGEQKEYFYKIVRGKKKGSVKLMELVSTGKVSVFKISISGSLGNSTANPISVVINHTSKLYYLSIKNDDIVDYVGARSFAIVRKSLKKGLAKYFKDCPELVKKIKKKEFKKRKIVEETVEFYNNNCN